MTSKFSASLDVLRRLVDGFDRVEAELPNDIMSAVEKVQAALGLDPAGTKTDLKSRIEVNIGEDGEMVALKRGVLSTSAQTNFTEDFTAFSVPRCFAMAMGEPDPTDSPVILAWSSLATNQQNLEVFATSGSGGVPSTSADLAWLMWVPQS